MSGGAFSEAQLEAVILYSPVWELSAGMNDAERIAETADEGNLLHFLVPATNHSSAYSLEKLPLASLLVSLAG